MVDAISRIPPRIVVRLEARREVVANNLAAQAVGQHTFESVAHLDFNLAFVRRDDHEHTIVLPGLTDAQALNSRLAYSSIDMPSRDTTVATATSDEVRCSRRSSRRSIAAMDAG